MNYIEELRQVIHKLHGVHSTHRQSVPVKEVFNGETIWEGIVEVFDLHDHPKADTAFAWSHATDDPDTPKRSVTVLKIPPAVSPQPLSEPSSYRSSAMPKQPKPEKKRPGRPKLAEDQAKGRIVPVRFKAEDLQKIAQAAQAKQQTVSQWIRSTLATALEA